jgi:hypothetical protein
VVCTKKVAALLSDEHFKRLDLRSETGFSAAPPTITVI